jgi:hypothetical protein
LHVGHVAVVTVVTALAVTVGGAILALGMGVLAGDPVGEGSFWTYVACDVALIVAGLIVVRTVDPLRAPTAIESHACGSCGRRFDSRQELRAHREAVHAPGPAVRPS